MELTQVKGRLIKKTVGGLVIESLLKLIDAYYVFVCLSVYMCDMSMYGGNEFGSEFCLFWVFHIGDFDGGRVVAETPRVLLVV